MVIARVDIQLASTILIISIRLLSGSLLPGSYRSPPGLYVYGDQTQTEGRCQGGIQGEETVKRVRTVSGRDMAARAVMEVPFARLIKSKLDMVVFDS